MDDTRYDVRMSWDQQVDFKKIKGHRYELMPVTKSDEICFIVCFDKEKDQSPLPTFAQTEQESINTGQIIGKVVVLSTYRKVKIPAGKSWKEELFFRNI